MAKQGIPSRELERSMNMTCHMMTIEEVLRNSEVIDTLDDKRREEHDEVLNNLFEILEKRDLEIEKKLKISLNDTQETQELKNILMELQQKYKKILELYIKKSISLRKKEKELEKIDDENRCYLIHYTREAKEKLKDENSRLEAEIINKRITND